MAFNIVKTEMIAKRESVAGTPETITSSDFDVRMYEPEFTPDIQGGDEDSKYVTGDYGEDIAISGIQGATFTTMTKLSSAGAGLDSAPKWGKLAESCGLVGTSYAGTGYGYEPLQSGDKQTSTFHKIGISDDGTPVGLESATAGVMGNMTISAEGVGSPLKLNYDFKGKFSGLTDIANGSIPSLTSPDTTVGAKFMNGTATIWGQSLCVQSFSLDIGNTVEYLACPSDSSGILYSSIINRQPRMEMTVIAPTKATFDPFVEITTEQEQSILLTFGDWSIEIPRGQILSYGESDANGKLAYDLTIKLNRNSGADATIQDESTFRLLQGATA
jgi:hypothetical protein